MRVLFSTVSPARYMRPPLLGDEQVVCGPDWSDESDLGGRMRSLSTPVGAYDLAAIAGRLPTEQAPDLVVCLVDASRRNLPGNLAAFKCPKVLLVADTHHLQAPVSGMIRYAEREKFDRVVLLYDRHHAEFFRAAGIGGLHWFPGLTFPHSDETVRRARCVERKHRIAFVGQAGRFHSRRRALLAAAAERGIVVETKALPQNEGLGFYGGSMLGFNASLNGDLNLRVFEILASGAALLTDRLGRGSGLERLFTDAREVLLFGDPDELAERAVAALASPAETLAVGAAGAQWFDRHLSEARRLAAFRTLAFDGVSPDVFAFPEEENRTRVFGGAREVLANAIGFYEELQELHRVQPIVRVALAPGLPTDVRAICETLPGVRCVESTLIEDQDACVVGTATGTAEPDDQLRLLWRHSGGDETWLMPGLVAKPGAPGVLVRPEEMASGSEPKHVVLRTDGPKPGGVAQGPEALVAALLAEAKEFLRMNRFGLAFAKVLAAIEKAPRCIEAHVLLGQLALKRPNGAAMAAKSFRTALSLAPEDMAIGELLAAVLCEQGRFDEALSLLTRLLKREPARPKAIRLQAWLLEGAKGTRPSLEEGAGE